MTPVFMLFQETDGSITYLYSYVNYDDAQTAAANLNLNKGANTTYTIIQGYRYGG